MVRAPCCSKVGLHKGPWSTKEDMLLTNYIQANGEGHWRSLPNKAGLLRCGKSCRLRWMNYLRPGIKRGNITPDEEDLIIRLHSLLGNRWSLIAGRLPGRTDNEIKNYWNTHLIKKLKNAGIEPKSNKKTTLPKRPTKESKKDNESNNATRKKKQNQKSSSSSNDDSNSEVVAKIKVCVPEPVNVSPGLTNQCETRCYSNSNSQLDSVFSSSSSTGGVLEMSRPDHDDEEIKPDDISQFAWSPLMEELGDSNNYGEIIDEQILMEDCNFSLKDFTPTISKMLEKVYDEYLQLL